MPQTLNPGNKTTNSALSGRGKEGEIFFSGDTAPLYS